MVNFFIGVLSTVFVEMAIIIGIAIYQITKKKER